MYHDVCMQFNSSALWNPEYIHATWHTPNLCKAVYLGLVLKDAVQEVGVDFQAIHFEAVDRLPR